MTVSLFITETKTVTERRSECLLGQWWMQCVQLYSRKNHADTHYTTGTALDSVPWPWQIPKQRRGEERRAEEDVQVI